MYYICYCNIPNIEMYMFMGLNNPHTIRHAYTQLDKKGL